MLISQADLARAADVSRKTVTVWKKRGSVVLKGEMVDVDATLARFREYMRDGHALAERVTTAMAEGVTGNKKSAKVTGAGRGVTASPDVDDPYPHRDHLTDAYDRAAVALLPVTAYRIGGAAALAAHDLGMAPETAERLRKQVACSAMELVCIILDEAGVFPPPGQSTWGDVALFDADKVATVDWAKVAAG